MCICCVFVSDVPAFCCCRRRRRRRLSSFSTFISNGTSHRWKQLYSMFYTVQISSASIKCLCVNVYFDFLLWITLFVVVVDIIIKIITDMYTVKLD